MIKHSELRKKLSYCKSTGTFTWLIRPNGRIRQGRIAGSLTLDGRRFICIDKKFYRASRLAWFYITGDWPEEIDHKDCNPSNDRWSNLRKCTRSQNQQNTRCYKNNSTGFKGVFLDSRSGRFRAQIQKDHQRISLGRFETAEAAFAARKKAISEIHGEFARAA